MSERDAYTLIAELDAPGGGAWQGAGQNKETGEWFMAHSRGSYLGGSREEVHFYRFAASDGVRKRYRDKMVCIDAGHVYGFGVSGSSILWFTWNTPQEGNQVVTLSYRPESTVRKGAGSNMHVFSDGDCQVSFSPTRDGLVVMEDLGNNRYSFTKRLKEDVLNNVDDPRGKVITRTVPSGTWLQGFSLAGEFLYILYGKTDSKAWIEKWSFASGEKVDSLDITEAGYLPGESRSGAKREPEGMDGRTFAVKVFTGGKRKLRIYQLNDF